MVNQLPRESAGRKGSLPFIGRLSSRAMSYLAHHEDWKIVTTAPQLQDKEVLVWQHHAHSRMGQFWQSSFDKQLGGQCKPFLLPVHLPVFHHEAIVWKVHRLSKTWPGSALKLGAVFGMGVPDMCPCCRVFTISVAHFCLMEFQCGFIIVH